MMRASVGDDSRLTVSFHSLIEFGICSSAAYMMLVVDGYDNYMREACLCVKRASSLSALALMKLLSARLSRSEVHAGRHWRE